MGEPENPETLMTEASYKGITFVPLADLTRPTNGARCLLGRWWVVHPQQGALIFNRYSPQCNTDKRLPERLATNLYPGCGVEFIPAAYVEIEPW